MMQEDLPKKGISFIIPMYNEEENIENVLQSLFAFLGTQNVATEVVVVNDGSTDNSAQIASSYPVQLMNHNKKSGYGKALKTGIKAANFEHVIFFDGDGQHSVNDLPLIMDRLLQCDAVIGQRKIRNSLTILRMLGKLFLRTSASLMLGVKNFDLNCGLRGFKTEVIKRYLHILPNGYSASLTSTLIMISRNYHTEYIPITASPGNGTSKMKIVQDGFKALNQIFRMAMLFTPWRIFGTTGVILIVLGFIYGVITYLSVKGFPASAVMVVSTGISSIFFGLLMDQIAEIRKEHFEQ